MTGYSYDHKDVFHVSPGLSSRLVESGVAPQKYEAWLSALNDLYDKCLDLGIKATDEIATAYPSLTISGRVEKATRQGSHVLRLLHYHMKKREGGLIGLGHKDDSFLTIHVADNFPGLKVGEEGNTCLAPACRDVALIYPGKKAERVTNGDIRALWHEIVDTRPELHATTQETKYRDHNLHRLAVVFFLDMQL
jgi:isopenicillin N synthase-like dioxygenase